MSVKAMAFVFGLEGIDPTMKFVLIAYADHADNDGNNIYPAVATIGKKTGYSERTVRYATHKLEAMRLLIQEGKGNHGTNRWILNMEWRGAPVAPAPVAPAPVAPEGVQMTTKRGAPHAPDPSLTININHPKSDASASDTVGLPLTEGLKFFLKSFGATRFKNLIQRDTMLALEKKHGTAKLKEFTLWAAKNGMTVSKAVVAAENGLQNWGKLKVQPVKEDALTKVARERGLR